MLWIVNGNAQEYHFSSFATPFCCNIAQFRPFFSLIEQFMQFGPADWPFLPYAFEYMKSVWPALLNTVNILCASGSSVHLGTQHSPSITFNLMTNFSGTRPMEFHRSGWFFRYQTNGISSITLIFQVPDLWSSIDLADFSSIRLMEFRWSGHWNFQTLCIPPLWVWIELNCTFGLWNTLQQISRK